MWKVDDARTGGSLTQLCLIQHVHHPVHLVVVVVVVAAREPLTGGAGCPLTPELQSGHWRQGRSGVGSARHSQQGRRTRLGDAEVSPDLQSSHWRSLRLFGFGGDPGDAHHGRHLAVQGVTGAGGHIALH